MATDELSVGLSKVDDHVEWSVVETILRSLNRVPLCRPKEFSSKLKVGMKWVNLLALFSGVKAPKSDLMIATFWLTLRRLWSVQVPKYFFPLALMRASSPPVEVDGGAVVVVPPELKQARKPKSVSVSGVLK
jgi:hypothetical protein